MRRRCTTVLSAPVLAGPHREISSVTPSTHLLMLMAYGGHLRKPKGPEGVVECPLEATVAAAAMVPQEVDMAPAQEGEDMAHQAAEGAMGRLRTEGVMDHHPVAMAGL